MAQFVFIQWLDDFIALALFNFDWDQGNNTKSLEKHGVLNQQAEESFYDENIIILGVQVSPEFSEARYGILGNTECGQLLFVSFTLRIGTIRIISARNANKKERAIYESQALR